MTPTVETVVADGARGTATWYRQAKWFNNKNGYRPAGHVVPPFSTKTIERGLAAMRELGYIDAHKSSTSPNGRRFQHSRFIYTNQFDAVGSTSATVIPIKARRSA